MQRHLGLVTIKGMIGSPYDRAIHKHGKDLTSPILMLSSCHAAAPSSWGSISTHLQTAGFGLVGCERYVMRPYPCFPLLSHASLELSRRWSVAWYSLMTIMVIILHQSPNSRPQRPTDRKSVGPRGAVAGRQGMAKPATWL